MSCYGTCLRNYNDSLRELAGSIASTVEADRKPFGGQVEEESLVR